MPSDSEQRGRASPPRRPTRKKSLKKNTKNTPETFSNMSQKERTHPSFLLNTTVNAITIYYRSCLGFVVSTFQGATSEVHKRSGPG